jgi:hypothetical protein
MCGLPELDEIRTRRRRVRIRQCLIFTLTNNRCRRFRLDVPSWMSRVYTRLFAFNPVPSCVIRS